MKELTKSYFFEFSGMPKAGKTTVIESVRHFFRRYGYSVQNFRGHDRGLPIDKSNAFELNLVLAMKAVEYVTTCSVADRCPTIHLLDRGLFDRTVFSEVLRKQGEISEDEAYVLRRVLLLEKNVKRMDGLFVFDIDPQISMEREYANTIMPIPGRIMNTDYLEMFRSNLQECYWSYGSMFSNASLVSTLEDSPKKTGIIIAKKIWEIIGGDLDEFPLH